MNGLTSNYLLAVLILSYLSNAQAMYLSQDNNQMPQNAVEEKPQPQSVDSPVQRELAIVPLTHHKDITEFLGQTLATSEMDKVEINITDSGKAVTLSGQGLKYLGAEIGKFQFLSALTVDNNSLTTIPEEIGTLKNLLDLDLSGNKITALPDLSGLQQLGSLRLSKNNLSELNESIFLLFSLSTLEVNNNQLTELPGSIGNLVELNYLRLKGNALTSIPDEIVLLTNLEKLDISDNKIDTLPENFVDGLSEFDASYNCLSKIPSSLFAGGQLTVLAARGNQLHHIPAGISTACELDTLDLQSNAITEISVEVGTLGSLLTLNLENNSLVDSETLSNLRGLASLTVLSLAVNRLEQFPDAIYELSQLRTLDVSSNQIKEIKPCIINLRYLTDVNLRDNQLTTFPYAFPDFLKRRVYITHLSILKNPLQSLPDLRKWKHLKFLAVERHAVEDQLPTLAKLPQLLDVDFGDFKLSGYADTGSDKKISELRKFVWTNNWNVQNSERTRAIILENTAAEFFERIPSSVNNFVYNGSTLIESIPDYKRLDNK